MCWTKHIWNDREQVIEEVINLDIGEQKTNRMYKIVMSR